MPSNAQSLFLGILSECSALMSCWPTDVLKNNSKLVLLKLSRHKFLGLPVWMAEDGNKVAKTAVGWI